MVQNINKFIYFIIAALFIYSCAHKQIESYETFTYNNPPVIGNYLGKDILLGGFSGLAFHKGDLYSLTDRGPNGEPFKMSVIINGKSKKIVARSFLVPAFVPSILKLRLSSGEIKMVERIELKAPNGVSLSGKPNKESFSEEIPVNLDNNIIGFDLNGIDSEGIAIDNQENFWLVEEYRPSLVKFSKDGVLLARFVPQNSFTESEISAYEKIFGKNIIKQILPAAYSQRAVNRGFEGAAIINGNLYAVMQSSLPFSSQKKSVSHAVRILEFNLSQEKVTGEYIYPFENTEHKIGDFTPISEQEFAIIEQNGEIGKSGFRKVYQVTLDPQKNILSYNKVTPELVDRAEWDSKEIPYLKKMELCDLNDYGLSFAEKIEGLAYSRPNLFVVIDNDFGFYKGELQKEQKTKIINMENCLSGKFK